MKLMQYRGYKGLKITANIGGDPTHHPIVFLHGGGQTRHSWSKAASDMIKAGYYVVSIDLRGHGDSEWAEDGDYSLDAHCGDLKAIIQTLPSAPALVGASLGGVISLITAGEGGENIASALVLVDVVPQMKPEGIDKVQKFLGSYKDGFNSIEEVADAVANYMPHRPRPSNTMGLMKNLRHGENGRLFWHWDPATNMGDPDATIVNEMGPRMEAAALHLRIPTLLVKGQLSELVDSEGVDALKGLIPHAELADVHGARHMITGDNNDIFNTVVEDFLQRKVTVT